MKSSIKKYYIKPVGTLVGWYVGGSDGATVGVLVGTPTNTCTALDHPPPTTAETPFVTTV